VQSVLRASNKVALNVAGEIITPASSDVNVTEGSNIVKNMLPATCKMCFAYITAVDMDDT